MIFFFVASASDHVCEQHIYNVFVHSSKVYCGRNDFGQQRYAETRQSCLVTPEKNNMALTYTFAPFL